MHAMVMHLNIIIMISWCLRVTHFTKIFPACLHLGIGYFVVNGILLLESYFAGQLVKFLKKAVAILLSMAFYPWNLFCH